MAAHYRASGHMERYEYREAIEAFREVRKRAPGWIPGAINLAIATLNDSGVKAEEAKKAGTPPHPTILAKRWTCSPAFWNESRTTPLPIFAGA